MNSLRIYFWHLQLEFIALLFTERLLPGTSVFSGPEIYFPSFWTSKIIDSSQFTFLWTVPYTQQFLVHK